MIRLRSVPSPQGIKATTRRGAVFHYYLMYMLLTSILLSAAGFSLHAVLDADQIDRRVAQQLKTLLKFERALREDLIATPVCSVKDEELQMMDPGGNVTVTWDFDDNRVSRTKSLRGEIDGRDMFVFPKGTTVSWKADGPFVTVTITEAVVSVGGKSVDDMAQTRVEIVLPKTSSAAEPAEGDAS